MCNIDLTSSRALVAPKEPIADWYNTAFMVKSIITAVN